MVRVIDACPLLAYGGRRRTLWFSPSATNRYPTCEIPAPTIVAGRHRPPAYSRFAGNSEHLRLRQVRHFTPDAANTTTSHEGATIVAKTLASNWPLATVFRQESAPAERVGQRERGSERERERGRESSHPSGHDLVERTLPTPIYNNREQSDVRRDII